MECVYSILFMLAFILVSLLYIIDA